MSRPTRRFALAAAVALATIARPSAALEPPSVWDFARRPGLEATERAIDAADDLIMQADELRQDASASRLHEPAAVRNLLLGARALLELAGAREAAEPRVRFRLGVVLSHLRDDAATVAALEPALNAFPDAPGATSAWFNLAIAYARMSRRDDEIAAYKQYLSREVDDSARHVALSNMAEAKVAQLDLRGAIESYQEAIALDPGPGGVLARWGLAVALDRSGDLVGALDEASRVLAVDDRLRPRLERGDVFFVPAYDVYWYRAVVAMGTARTATNADERWHEWELAEEHYARYLASALSTDPWVPLAKVRRAFCEALARRTAAAAKRAKPKKAPPFVSE